ncbi:MAG TPA: flagellar protein FlaG [Steroidobacter sp.]
MSIDKVTFGVRATELATERSQVPPYAAPVASSASRSDAEARSNLAAETEAQIERIVEQLESYLRSVSRSLEFRVDAETGRTVVSVRDAQTGELIRQIPSEEVLRLAEMAEDQTIVLVNETV